jgi:hypothetical protein
VRTSQLPLPKTNDSRLFLAGIVAVLALVVYLAVAFANMHLHPLAAPTATSKTNPFAPFVRSNSKLVRLPHRKKGGLTLRVTPAGPGYFGALAPTLVSEPPSRFNFVLSLWLKGARPGKIGIELDEFRSSGPSPKLVDATVPATAKWRRFTFNRRVSRGSWLGLGLFVYRVTSTATPKKWFEVRDVSVQSR